MRPEVNSIVAEKLSRRQKLVRSLAAVAVAGASFIGSYQLETNTEPAVAGEGVNASDVIKTNLEIYPTPKYGPHEPTDDQVSMLAGEEYEVGLQNALKEQEQQKLLAAEKLKENQFTAQSESIQPMGATDLTAEEIVKVMYLLESGNGAADSCKDQGKVNGYGYGQSTTSWNCYDSHEEVKALVTAWVQDKIDRGFSTAQIFCFYQTGSMVETCTNYSKYLNLQ